MMTKTVTAMCNPAFQDDSNGDLPSTPPSKAEPKPSSKKKKPSSTALIEKSLVKMQDVGGMDPDDQRRHQIYIWKNLLLISLGVLGVMTAYDTLRYVETSINSAHDIGVASLASIYAALVLCSLLAPTLLIRKIGSKWTFELSVLCFALYFSSHFYMSFYTMVPGAIIMGFGISFLHTSSNCYVTELALTHAKTMNLESNKVINTFFGVFIMITFTPRILGSLISSVILDIGDAGGKKNNTQLHICGAHYCNQDLHTSSHAVDVYQFGNLSHNTTMIDEAFQQSKYSLYGVTVGICIGTAILISFVLDNNRKKDINNENHEQQQETFLQHVVATLKQMKDFRQILLILITFTLGLIESYMSGDFTKAFVTCSLDVHWVGKVVICYGATAAISSYIWGWLANAIGRPPVIILATILNIGDIIAMLFWQPDPDNIVVYYVLAGVWGVADAVWRSQLYAFYGSTFSENKEAAFSNFEVWESIGLSVGYAWAPYLCIDTKLYVILICLILGVIGYLCVEMKSWPSLLSIRRFSTISKL